MKTMTRKEMFEWLVVLGIALVLILAILAIVKPVGATSVCGPTIGNAAIVENALVIAGVPHMVIEKRSAPIVTCQAIGCPKPRPATCLGWRIRISTTGAGYMVGKTYIPARYIELTFNKYGVFKAVQ